MGLEPKVSRRTPALARAAKRALRLIAASGWLGFAALPVVAEEELFRWPVSGRVITYFAESRGTGINIEAPEGSPVRAADDGQVIYAGSGVEGYGNLVLLRHPNEFVSAYAHLRDFSVARGDVVERGAQIGTAGMTGSVSKPQLHFELRDGATPVDPIPLLAGGYPAPDKDAADPAGEALQAVIDEAPARSPEETLDTIIAGGENPGAAVAPFEKPHAAPVGAVLIAKVQRGLVSLGFLHGPADGIAGPATRKAIRNFEVYFNYQVTGTVSPELLDLLVEAGASF